MNAQAEIIPAEVRGSELANRAHASTSAVVAQANAMVIENADDYADGVAACQGIARDLKALETERRGITDPIRASIERTMAFFQLLKGPREQADTIIRGKLKAYDVAQKAIADKQRQEAEAAAAEERRKIETKAAEERRKADEKAAQEREEARRQQAEKIRQQKIADDAKRAGDREAARIAQQQANEAAALAAKSETKAAAIDARAEQKVEALQNRATSIVAPLIVAPVQKVAGKSSRVVWKWRLTDGGKSVGRGFLAVDDSKITKAVNAMKKDAEGVIGGIEVWSVDDLSIKAAKP